MAKYFYTGGVDRSPFQDIHAYKERVKKHHPDISDHGVSVLAKRSLDMIKPRNKKRVVAFFGRDILTDDLESLWFWPMLKPYQRGRIAAHPIEGGQRYDPGDPVEKKQALLGQSAYHTVNREVLVASYAGIQMEYSAVFSAHTQWEQEISDRDASILLSYPRIRHLLVREDRYTGYNPVPSYSHIPVRDSQGMSSIRDLNYQISQFRRKNSTQGVDVPKERT